MKCKILWVDRGKGILKNGKYDNIIGEFNKGFFKGKEPFYIPEKFKNIVL